MTVERLSGLVLLFWSGGAEVPLPATVGLNFKNWGDADTRTRELWQNLYGAKRLPSESNEKSS